MRNVAFLTIDSSMFDGLDVGSALAIGENRAYFGHTPAVVDISSPENPRIISMEGWIGDISDLNYRDGYLFASLMCCGVEAINVADSDIPTVYYIIRGAMDGEVGRESHQDRCAVYDNYIYAGIDELGVLIIKRNF